MTAVQQWYSHPHVLPFPLAVPQSPPDAREQMEPHIARLALRLDRNSVPTWEEDAVRKQGNGVIKEQEVSAIYQRDPVRSLGLEQEIGIKVDPFQDLTRTGLRLYPAFGEVTDVDLVRGRVYVRLLESPLAELLYLPLYGKDNIISPLHRQGQLFEALATLAANDPNEFRLGNCHVIESEEPESFYDAISGLAEPAAEFRF